MNMYIWQRKDWPCFSWNTQKLLPLLEEIAHAEGRLQGYVETLDPRIAKDQQALAITQEIEKSWSIEGEKLDELMVYSSVCRRLQIEDNIPHPTSGDHIEGIVDVMMDIVENAAMPLTEQRLFAWHRNFFPTGYSGELVIQTGAYRKKPMEIVKGPLGKTKVIFEAPEAKDVPSEMAAFMQWLNTDNEELSIKLKSAIAHLWFVTIHPFEDGNGRCARAISDYVLSKDSSVTRLYSLSVYVKRHQKQYYDELNKAQTGNLEITSWLVWYLGCLLESIDSVLSTVDKTIRMAKFFEKANSLHLNSRQEQILVKLAGDWKGPMTTSKWAKICTCSQDTASRDIKALIDKGLLKKVSSGPATHYELTLDT